MTGWQKKPNKEAYLVTGTKTFENPTVQWQAAAHKGTEARADVPLGDAANLPAAATGIPPMFPRGVDVEVQKSRAAGICRGCTSRSKGIKLHMILSGYLQGPGRMQIFLHHRFIQS